MALLTPEFLQTKTYNALRDRVAFQHGGPIQAGAWDANDFKVVQRAAGANMSVDVNPGFALINANDPGNAGLYHQQNDAAVNVSAFSASHATLPRIDSVALQINDTMHGGDATDVPNVVVLTGTPTSGATLDNRSGAAALPNSHLLLSDILIPAASTSIVTANIRDRRTWARGASQILVFTGGDVTTGAGLADVGGSGTVELSGAPVQITAAGGVYSTTASTAMSVVTRIRLTNRNTGTLYTSPGSTGAETMVRAQNTITNLSQLFTYQPPAGNYTYALQLGGNGAHIAAIKMTDPPLFVALREFPTQNSGN